MIQDIKRVDLEDWGVLKFSGPDVVTFLQGQLSNDVSRVAAATSVLAGYHNPQGRTIALLRLVKTASGDLLAVLPRELISDLIARLRKFVLRAKVVLTDESDAWRVVGVLCDQQADDILQRLSVVGAQSDRASWIQVEGTRQRRIAVVARAVPDPFAELASVEREEWKRLDIEDGVPQIYKATSEAFVAQMLNLDVLNGIAFDKGCYTGQEVIARAHYRGRVKRRMQRFRSTAAALLVCGDAGRLQDGRSFKVVEAIQLADGRCEFLAVAAMAAETSSASATATTIGETLSAAASRSTANDDESSAGAGPTLAAEQLALPYALPE